MAQDALCRSRSSYCVVLSCFQKLDLQLDALNHLFVLVQLRLGLAGGLLEVLLLLTEAVKNYH